MQRLGIHPAALAIFVIGLAVLISAHLWQVIRQNAAPPSTPVQATAISSASTSERESGPMRFVVTVPPLAWAVSQLAPADAEITTLVPQGANCEGIELTPGQVVSIDRADVIVTIGLGLDDEVASLSKRSTRPLRQHLIFGELLTNSDLLESAHDHAHDHDHDHDHAHLMNPHIWLDPLHMERLIVALGERMKQSATGTDDLDLRIEKARAVCREIDQEYTAGLRDVKTRKLVTHHDAYNYLAKRYNLEIVAVIQQSHEIEPTAGEIASAAEAVRANGLSAIFIEPQLSESAARRIAELTNSKLLTLDPLGSGDWPTLMRSNLAALQEGLTR